MSFNHYLANKISICQIYPISKFTTAMCEGGFGPWSVDVGDTEVPGAREYYEKLCNVKSWTELKQILCPNTSGASKTVAPVSKTVAPSKMDLKKQSELYERASRIVAKLEGSVARI